MANCQKSISYAFLALTGAILLLDAGCSGNFTPPSAGESPYSQGTGPSKGASPDVASSKCAEILFAGTVWNDVLAPRCSGCHLENGFAQQVGSKFHLPDRRQPNYMADNLASFRQFAAMDSNGTSYLLAKATNRVTHQGGEVLDPNGAEYAEISAFLARKDLSDGCTPTIAPEALSAIPMKTPAQVVRRAALQLAGRLPTAQEVQMATANNLNGALNNYFSDPNFAALVKRSYEDTFLVDAYNYGNVIGFLYDTYYGKNYVQNVTQQVVEAWGFAHNATELASYIITQDRPYTEILTADYMMLNAEGACNIMGPGHSLQFKTSCTLNNQPMNTCSPASFAWGPLDECSEFVAAKPTRARFPQIGVLSDGALFTVYQSTPSNKNRHRAAMVMRTFLGLDPLSLGPRVAPNTAAPAASDTPTMVVAQCEVCHRLVDGVASSFQNWDMFMQMGELEGIYAPGIGGYFGKYADQFTPRFNGALMPNNTTEPLQWMSTQIVADPRFAYTAVTTWYTILTGQPPLPDPASNDPNYVSSLAMKLYQNQFFQDQATLFTKNNYSVQSLIKQLIGSPWYQAGNASTATSASLLAQTRTFDTASRRGPEVLNQALEATMGHPWYHPNGQQQGASTPMQRNNQRYLLNDFRISYGGIDSLNTTVRNTDMSSVAAAVANFMAQDAPCQTVANDFGAPAANRALFPYVELSTTPDTASGLAQITQNIAYLHQRLLGETLASNDPELAATVAVFKQVYANHASSTALKTTCQTNAVSSDNTHTVHAWMAVLTYLLSDFNFLYQ